MKIRLLLMLLTMLAIVLVLPGCSGGGTDEGMTDSVSTDPIVEVPAAKPQITPISCNANYAIPLSEIAYETDTGNSSNTNALSSIIDGDKTNASTWSSNNELQTLIMTLAQPALVKEFVISWGDQSVSHYYDIDTSTDGDNWDNVVSSAQSEKDYIIADRVQLGQLSQTAKYIKISLNGTESTNNNSITEIEVFGCSQDVSHSVELIDWYLSVQTDEDNNGKSDSISESNLSQGYEDPRFFYIDDESGLVFSSTVQGFKTSTNTQYVRSELREMLRSGDTSHKTQGVNKNNWVFSSAPQNDIDSAGGVDGTLDVDVAVNHVTSTGEAYQIGRVIIGQIHANDDEPVRLYYRKLPQNKNGSIYFAHELLDGDDTYHELIGSRSNSASDPENGIPLNERFQYQIQVQGNTLIVTVTKQDGQIFSKTVDMSTSGYDQGGQYMYFKAGVYNVNNSGDIHDYVQATFYQITNSHSGYQE